MLRLEGRTVVITGGNRGIGRAAVERMAAEGARVLLTSRDPDAGARAAREVRALTGNPEVESLAGDLSTREGVRAVAEAIRRRIPRLHVLVHNAGTSSRTRVVTADGWELLFAVNHMAPFLLTRLLLPLLEASAPARVITVASRAHRRVRMRWDDLQLEKRYSGLEAYGRSKLANVLFNAELARRLEGTGVTALALHPGVYGTGIVQELAGPVGRLLRALLPDPGPGGAAIAELAADPKLAAVSGVYFEKGVPVSPSPEGRDPEAARRLWEVSEALLEG